MHNAVIARTQRKLTIIYFALAETLPKQMLKF